tara:strand:- start:413 stop:643 length:231 start_codon:yes stop_codon:yes gene_type:complete
MELDSFNIDQMIKVQGKSLKGKTRITEHGDVWRIKSKLKKGQIPWIKEDSILLESLKDGITARWLNLSEDKHFKLI